MWKYKCFLPRRDKYFLLQQPYDGPGVMAGAAWLVTRLPVLDVRGALGDTPVSAGVGVSGVPAASADVQSRGGPEGAGSDSVIIAPLSAW